MNKSVWLCGALEVAEAFHQLPEHLQKLAERLDDQRIGDRVWEDVEALCDEDVRTFKGFYDLMEATGIRDARSINCDLADVKLGRDLTNPKSVASLERERGYDVISRSGRVF